MELGPLLERASRRVWGAAGPWLTFAVTMGLAAFIYTGGAANSQALGFAEAEVVNVASVETGRIVSIAVEPGQEVLPGQVVARLDTSALDAEIAVLEAEKTRLLALIPIEQAEEAQRLDEAVERIERELAREQEELSRARSEQRTLDTERARAKKLVEDKLASTEELTKLDVLYATIKPVVEEKPRTVELLRKQLAAAQKRRQQAAEAHDAAARGPFGGDLLVTTRELEQLRQQRSELELKAVRRGRISQIWKRAGEVAVAGEPIVSSVSSPGRVVACVPEAQALRVGAGDKAKLWVRDASGKVAGSGAPLSGTAVTVGPLVTEMPLRCRRIPTVPTYGREVTITLDQPVELLAGQAFNVELDWSHAPSGAPPSSPPASLAGAGAGASATELASGGGASKSALMNVPASLRGRSRLEPSGALWRPDLQRYVLVSDDTGLEDADDKAPWLFAMTREGAIDPEPLPIAGVASINDLESIAAGDSGEVYVLASQSHSRKGKRPAARTAFMRLLPDGRGFRLDAAASLADALEAAGEGAMAKLGLPNGTRDLEIEGMAFRGGALYLGLKAPLDAQGNAIIWKLGDPGALLSQKSLSKAALSLFAKVRVEAEAGQAKVPGGISELLFLPDGALMIASTPSSGDGAPETGRLYHAPASLVSSAAGGALSPREVKTFPGLKPEGLSLSATPGRVVVVFDTGSDVPSWTEIPWPG
jgi:multidrug resistance efflux pump